MEASTDKDSKNVVQNNRHRSEKGQFQWKECSNDVTVAPPIDQSNVVSANSSELHPLVRNDSVVLKMQTNTKHQTTVQHDNRNAETGGCQGEECNKVGNIAPPVDQAYMISVQSSEQNQNDDKYLETGRYQVDECSKVVGVSPSDGQSVEMVSTQSPELHPLICNVCKRTFREPRILPCLHTFCAGCIPGLRNMDRLMLTESTDTDMEGAIVFTACKHLRITCPVCQWQSKITRNVLDLPRNLYIERQLFLDTLRNKTVAVCEACLVSEDVDDRVVVSRCLHCGENLCQGCSKFHKRQKRTSAHIVVDIDSSVGLAVGTGKSRPVTWLKSYKCHKHEDEDIKVYCVECENVLCRDCVVLDHRTHQCKFVDDTLKDGTAELKKSMDTVCANLHDLKKHLDNLKKHKNKVKDETASVRIGINDFMNKYIEAIEQHRRNLNRDLDGILAAEEKRVDSRIMELESLKGTLEYACSFTSSIVEKGSDIEIMSIKHILSKRLDQVGQLRFENDTSADSKINIPRFSQKNTIAVGDFIVMGKIMSKSKAFPEKCRLTGDGLTHSRRGFKSKVHLTITDDLDQPMGCLDGVNVEATVFAESDVKRLLPVSIHPNPDGVYTISFKPEMAGRHFLTIKVDGNFLQGSRCCVDVKGKPVPHLGIWHCCAFCSSNGNRAETCGCGAKMPGGFNGCGHGHQGHPGTFHWSCCGAVDKRIDCTLYGKRQTETVQQFTL